MISLLLAIIYLAFIGLGLPDSLLGSAWPTIRLEMGIPVSYAGIVSMIIAIGTIISSLLSSRVIQKFGPGLVTAVSVGLTAVALFGFSISNTFILLCLWAVPYGLGGRSCRCRPQQLCSCSLFLPTYELAACFLGIRGNGQPIHYERLSYQRTGLAGWVPARLHRTDHFNGHTVCRIASVEAI